VNRTNRQKTAFVGKGVFAWSFIVVAAQIMAVGPQLRGRAAGARIVGIVITAPGALMAEQLGVRNTGPATDWTYSVVVFLCSLIFWVGITIGLQYIRKRYFLPISTHASP
jgi:hypothetical protein